MDPKHNEICLYFARVWGQRTKLNLGKMHLSVGTSVAAWEGGTTAGGIAWGLGTGVRPHDFSIAHPTLLTPVNSLLSSHRLTKRSTPSCPGAFQDG